jgi:hypothetical protein
LRLQHVKKDKTVLNFNIDPLQIDLARPGEAFLKSVCFLSIGTIFEGTDINHMHLPPIIIEVAKTLAYLGASVAFFKFLIGIFRPKTKEENKQTDVKEKDE